MSDIRLTYYARSRALGKWLITDNSLVSLALWLMARSLRSLYGSFGLWPMARSLRSLYGKWQEFLTISYLL
ncbi:MAG TPA: hypothetical protein VFM05_09335 [Candidatus Saccharimonadales bacterium]|nr:hypothetical protein [Candidatus Saccharimonadales bacterium]